MGMVDEFVRQKGMQQRFDRRVGRRCIQQIDPLRVDHILVTERRQCRQFADRLQPDRRQAGRFDIAQIPAAALDAQHRRVFTQHIGHDGFDRRIAAAMQDQPLFVAQQAGGIDP